MGLGSFFKGLGKGLVKVGKFAVPAVLAATGVGAPLAAAAAGGLNTLDKKLSGGSWKDSLIQGGIGAGLGYAGAKIPGIGPSGKVVDAATKSPGIGSRIASAAVQGLGGNNSGNLKDDIIGLGTNMAGNYLNNRLQPGYGN